jgi:arylsulfatase A-like enzyme
MKILVLDAWALHIGYLGCYGTEWVATPHLDRLAAEGVVFDRHLADSPQIPNGGVRSAWSGRYRLPLSEEQANAEQQGGPALLQLLKDHKVPAEFVAARAAANEVLADLRGPLKKLQSEGNRLLWLDYPRLAPPWQVPEEFLQPYFPEEELEPDEEPREPLIPWPDPPTGPLDEADLERLQNTYAAAVTYFDHQLGRLLDELQARDLVDEVMLVVTSSCGLALGEHGYVGPYRAWLHEEVVHVPLIVRLPGAAEAGSRTSALTQSIDLLPTLLESFRLQSPDAHGQSLWPLLRGEREQVRAYACSGLQIGESFEWALRTPEWALLLPLSVPAADPPRKPRLYLKPDDRWEVNDVSQHHLELAEHLERVLRDFAAASAKPGSLQAPEL